MATHSSTLAWRIPLKEEPGRLQSMGSRRVGHNRATSLSLSLCVISAEGDSHNDRKMALVIRNPPTNKQM